MTDVSRGTARPHRALPESPVRPFHAFPPVTASKFPEITAAFWIIKILTTGIGETTSDYFVLHGDPVFAVLSGALLFSVALLAQLAVRQYIPWVYWLTVAMVSVFGTMVTDVAHVGYGVPYAISCIAFAVVLTAIFATWFKVERNLWPG
ncbi:MAG: hypothetical protein ABI053_06435 [Lacisediminihabitans sp.]